MSDMHGRSASEPSEDPANRALVWKVSANSLRFCWRAGSPTVRLRTLQTDTKQG
jgi:hypothetical protein